MRSSWEREALGREKLLRERSSGKTRRSTMGKTLHEGKNLGPDTFDRIFRSNVSQFIITNNLFAPLMSTDKGKYMVGNPLFKLFDLIEGNNIEDGDIVYIKGAKKYELKH